jgi:hypothetical protein
VNCDALHGQSCHEFCMHESEYVARQLSLSLYIYVNIYIYIYIYVYIYIYMYVFIHAYIHRYNLDAAAKHWCVRWRVVENYASDNDINQTKGGGLHESFELVHYSLN